MASMTKAQLAAENATLRAELSALRTQLEVHTHLTAPAHPLPSDKYADYATYAEAAANCKRLASSELNKCYVFTQIGTRVIARPRSAS